MLPLRQGEFVQQCPRGVEVEGVKPGVLRDNPVDERPLIRLMDIELGVLPLTRHRAGELLVDRLEMLMMSQAGIVHGDGRLRRQLREDAPDS